MPVTVASTGHADRLTHEITPVLLQPGLVSVRFRKENSQYLVFGNEELCQVLQRCVMELTANSISSARENLYVPSSTATASGIIPREIRMLTA